MAQCKHPNVVKMTESFETEDEVYIATSFQKGGDLIQHINTHWDGQSLTEDAVKSLSFGIAKGLHYLHSHNIVHRDIKPENIVLSEDTKDSPTPQIVDFGFARKMEKGGSCKGALGTLPYVAPEVLSRRPYDFSCDVWSFGVMVFGLLSGDHPFLKSANVNFDDMRKIFSEREANFDSAMWNKVTPECRELVEMLLIKDPTERPNIEAVLMHPWFTDLIVQ